MGESRKRITAIPLLQASCGVVCGVCAESESKCNKQQQLAMQEKKDE